MCDKRGGEISMLGYDFPVQCAKRYSDIFQYDDTGGIYSRLFTIVKYFLQGVYAIVFRAGIYIAAIGLIGTFIAFTRYATKPERLKEEKDLAQKRAIVLVIFFAVIGIVDIVQGAGF